MKAKDVLHLYLGCQWHQDGGYPIELTGSFIEYILGSKTNDHGKPILRPLSDMTEEERAEIFYFIFGRQFKGRTEWYKEKTTLQEPRWVLSQGVDRVGIQMNGDIWADCDLHVYKMNPHKNTLYLLSKSFDLFGLIDSGEAIDKTKNNPQ